MKTAAVVALAILANTGGVAFARDHLELACTAVADSKDGGDKVPLLVHVFEQRDADGESRDETLSMIYQGKLFQATRVNKSGGFTKDAPIALMSGAAIRFRGAYTLDNSAGAGPYTLALAGTVADDPSARKPTWRDVHATLACVDLSI